MKETPLETYQRTGKSIYRQRVGETPPSKKALALAEGAFGKLTGCELSDFVDAYLNAVLNQTDALPPLRERASARERKSRADLVWLVDQLKATVLLFKQAYEDGDTKRAAFFYAAFHSHREAIDAKWNDPEVYRGAKNIAATAKGGREKAVQTADYQRKKAARVCAAVESLLAKGRTRKEAYTEVANCFTHEWRRILPKHGEPTYQNRPLSFRTIDRYRKLLLKK